MPLQPISPQRAKQLLGEGALLIDIREADEHERERIPQARLQPLSTLQSSPIEIGQAARVIFHCKSGGRTTAHAARLAAATSCEGYILDGGLEAWKRAGLPIATDPKQRRELSGTCK